METKRLSTCKVFSARGFIGTADLLTKKKACHDIREAHFSAKAVGLCLTPRRRVIFWIELNSAQANLSDFFQ